MPQNELYRNFLDRKFDELLQAINRLIPVQNNRNSEGGNNGTNTRRTV